MKIRLCISWEVGKMIKEYKEYRSYLKRNALKTDLIVKE